MSKPINHSKPWIIEDRENLVAMVVARYDWVMISNFLGRTLNATLAEFYRIANHPNEDELKLSKLVQPYKNCYNWKEGHTDPSDVDISQLPDREELKSLIGKKFVIENNEGTVLVTVKAVFIAENDEIYVTHVGNTNWSYLLVQNIKDCNFITECVYLD